MRWFWQRLATSLGALGGALLWGSERVTDGQIVAKRRAERVMMRRNT